MTALPAGQVRRIRLKQVANATSWLRISTRVMGKSTYNGFKALGGYRKKTTLLTTTTTSAAGYPPSLSKESLQKPINPRLAKRARAGKKLRTCPGSATYRNSPKINIGTIHSARTHNCLRFTR